MGVEIRVSFRDSFGRLSTKKALELSAEKWEKIEDLLQRLDYEVLGSTTCAACSKFDTPSCSTGKNVCPLGTPYECCDNRWGEASEAISEAHSAAAGVKRYIRSVIEKLPTKKTR